LTKANAERLLQSHKGTSISDISCNVLLDRIRLTPYSDPGFDWIRNQLEQQIKSAAHQLLLDIKDEPIIGALRAPILNAKVIRVPGTNESLIVLNSEIFRLPYEVAKSVVDAIGFKDMVKNKFPIS
jgi:hypothetical protein